MSKSIKTFLALVMFASLVGCAFVATGRYPIPSGVGVERQNETTAKIELPDYQVKIQIEGYTGDVGLVGIGVPIIPVGQWKWLTGIGKDDLRIEAHLSFLPKTKTGQFEPGSVRIIVNGEEHSPSEVKKSKYCRNDRAAATVEISEPLHVEEELCLAFKFPDLRPPDQSFLLTAKGFPKIEYVLERKTHAGFAKQ